MIQQMSIIFLGLVVLGIVVAAILAIRRVTMVSRGYRADREAN